jgi:hypothetical protein
MFFGSPSNSLILNYFSFDILPSQLRLQSFSCHIAIERIMTEFLAVIGKICQHIIDLADQKILTIIQAGDGWGSLSPAPNLTGFYPAR